MATVTSRHRDEQDAGIAPPADRPQWWAVVRDTERAIAGLAMRTARTPPHPMFVLPMADDAALDLARAVHERGETVGGLNGSLPAASVMAGELARLQGDEVEVAQHTRLFELGELRPARRRARDAPRPRPSTTSTSPRSGSTASCTTPTCRQAVTPLPHGREEIEPEDLRRRIEAGTYWFWLDEAGERVHLTGANPPAFGVARIGPVYTPPEQRRKGYAGAAVAEVSRIFLDAGARVCLYTDQANPTSNGIYQAIGYQPVVDQVNLRIVPG